MTARSRGRPETEGERIVRLETIAERLVVLVDGQDRRLDAIERNLARVLGALGVLVITANLVAPIILRALHLAD